jgi:hypothetical protein
LKLNTWNLDTIEPIAVELFIFIGMTALNENYFVWPGKIGVGITNKDCFKRTCCLTAPPEDIFHLVS